MPKPDADFDHVVTGHEERLQRVESTVQDTAIKVAEICVKQDHATSAMESGFSRIEASVEKIVDRVHGNVEKLESYGDRLAPLEAHVRDTMKSKKARIGLLKKSAIGALLAAGGVFATKAGEWLWTAFSR